MVNDIMIVPQAELLERLNNITSTRFRISAITQSLMIRRVQCDTSINGELEWQSKPVDDDDDDDPKPNKKRQIVEPMFISTTSLLW